MVRHSRAGGNLKALALRLFISFPFFRGIHEHSVVPNQVGNDELPKPVIQLLCFLAKTDL